jgi:hypothetical protein
MGGAKCTARARTPLPYTTKVTLINYTTSI